MINTSKKAARKLGADLATELHGQQYIEARSGVLAAKSVILAQFGYAAQTAFLEGFSATLDVLEPLPSGRARRP